MRAESYRPPEDCRGALPLAGSGRGISGAGASRSARGTAGLPAAGGRVGKRLVVQGERHRVEGVEPKALLVASVLRQEQP
jgi:hypothetical protein